MYKITPIVICTICISGSAVSTITAADAQKKLMQSQYNPETTRKLQTIMDVTKNWDDLTQPPSLKEVEQLIKDGANPNLTTKDATLIEHIVYTPFWNKNIDMALLEGVVRTMTEHGLRVVIDPNNYGSLVSNLMLGASPNIINMVINAGGNKQMIEQNREIIMKSAKAHLDSYLKELRETQNHVDRFQQIVSSIEPAKSGDKK